MKYLITLVLAALLAVPITPAVASNRIPEPSETDVRVLSQMCIGEAGWRGGETGECAAIIHVMLWLQGHRMRGWRLQTVARVYSAVFKTRYRPWIMGLNLSNTRPAYWRSASWPLHRPLWESTVLSVRETLSGERINPCPRARDWGSVSDGSPSPRSVEVQCTQDFRYPGRRLEPNRFWTIPSALEQPVNAAVPATGGVGRPDGTERTEGVAERLGSSI